MKRLNAPYMRGYRAGIRLAIELAESFRDTKIARRFVAKRTAEWLRLVHDRADEYADGDRPELWIAPDGKLFFKDRKNCCRSASSRRPGGRQTPGKFFNKGTKMENGQTNTNVPRTNAFVCAICNEYEKAKAEHPKFATWFVAGTAFGVSVSAVIHLFLGG